MSWAPCTSSICRWTMSPQTDLTQHHDLTSPRGGKRSRFFVLCRGHSFMFFFLTMNSDIHKQRFTQSSFNMDPTEMFDAPMTQMNVQRTAHLHTLDRLSAFSQVSLSNLSTQARQQNLRQGCSTLLIQPSNVLLHSITAKALAQTVSDLRLLGHPGGQHLFT